MCYDENDNFLIIVITIKVYGAKMYSKHKYEIQSNFKELICGHIDQRDVIVSSSLLKKGYNIIPNLIFKAMYDIVTKEIYISLNFLEVKFGICRYFINSYMSKSNGIYYMFPNSDHSFNNNFINLTDIKYCINNFLLIHSSISNLYDSFKHTHFYELIMSGNFKTFLLKHFNNDICDYIDFDNSVDIQNNILELDQNSIDSVVQDISFTDIEYNEELSVIDNSSLIEQKQVKNEFGLKTNCDGVKSLDNDNSYNVSGSNYVLDNEDLLLIETYKDIVTKRILNIENELAIFKDFELDSWTIINKYFVKLNSWNKKLTDVNSILKDKNKEFRQLNNNLTQVNKDIQDKCNQMNQTTELLSQQVLSFENNYSNVLLKDQDIGLDNYVDKAKYLDLYNEYYILETKHTKLYNENQELEDIIERSKLSNNSKFNIESVPITDYNKDQLQELIIENLKLKNDINFIQSEYLKAIENNFEFNFKGS